MAISRRRGLVVGQRPVGDAGDEEVDLVARQRGAVALPGDDIDRAHVGSEPCLRGPAGSILPKTMSQASQLSPEVGRDCCSCPRDRCSSAARSWTLYPPEHPAVGASVPRLPTLSRGGRGRRVRIGVTPDTLLVDGPRRATEADLRRGGARYLHDRDVCQLTFVGDPSRRGARARSSGMLCADPAECRARGGPAAAVGGGGHAAIADVEQIDYREMLSRDGARSPRPPRARRRLAGARRRRSSAARRRSTSARSSACSRSRAARATSATSPRP